MKISKIIKGAVLATFAVLMVAGGVFAVDLSCIGSDKKYSNLTTAEGSSEGYPVKCVRIWDDSSNAYVTIYGKTSADCTQASAIINSSDGCSASDMNDMIRRIINLIIFIVGLVAVVMMILGGISYATSQGDPGKVKKAKDTILYGIIGLVVSILAFSIINFIITNLN